MADPLFLGTLPAVTGNELVKLQQGCLRKLGLPLTPLRFPGSQPVSFERHHLAEIGEQVRASGVYPVYYVAEKTDGMRYMLMIVPRGEGAWMIDRNFNMRRLGARFPSVKPGQFLGFTLLDGELVEDTDRSTGRSSLRYLVYDACVVDNTNVTQRTLHMRLHAVRHLVLGPWFEKVPFDSNLFRIELKDQFDLTQLHHIFDSITPSADKSKHLFTFTDVKQVEVRRRGDDGGETTVVTTHNLEHGTDGIIFTPINTPYVYGTDRKVLKWKPAEMNSVDFAYDENWKPESNDDPRLTPRFMLQLAKDGVLKRFKWIHLDDADRFVIERARRTLQGRRRDAHTIIECVWDPDKQVELYDPAAPTWQDAHYATETGGWRFERVRADKSMPNAESTVNSVIASIEDGVTKEELLAAFS